VYLRRPRLFVRDSENRLDIDLRRTAIVRFPFAAELTEAVCREILAVLLVRTAPTRSDAFRQICRTVRWDPRMQERADLASLNHPAVSLHPWEGTAPPGYRPPSWLALVSDGLSLGVGALQAGAHRAFVVDEAGPDADDLHERALRIVPDEVLVRTIRGEARGCLRSQTQHTAGALLIPTVRLASEHSEEFQDRIRELGNGWAVAWKGEDPGPLLEGLALCEARADDAAVVMLPAIRADDEAPVDPLTQLWLDLFERPTVPLDLRERRHALAFAYRELRPEIERIERGASLADSPAFVEGTPRGMAGRPQAPGASV
jgi:hypothetical protein